MTWYSVRQWSIGTGMLQVKRASSCRLEQPILDGLNGRDGWQGGESAALLESIEGAEPIRWEEALIELASTGEERSAKSFYPTQTR